MRCRPNSHAWSCTSDDHVSRLGHYAAPGSCPTTWPGKDSVGHNAPGRLASVGAVHRDPTQAGAFFGFAAPKLSYDRHNPEQQKRLLGNAFSGLGWDVSRLLASPHQTLDLHFAPCNLSPDTDVMSA
ncbi:hypothetical protein [Streptomyces regalis]|uniref:Uncharacterized protein n=1 Tax=Streptomyces regalis TaxID=68262 RepID=A0A0X3VNL1_9ACTN|nr:hypothetical protein [Streptomyces regalis]KUL45146.1 hypothetical protein ADL12_04370 [Streptomyces regalis]